MKIVRSSWEAKVLNRKGKDILVNFYANWCSHCRELKKPYRELAEGLLRGGTKDLVLAEFDTEKNDIPPGVSMSGLPTILLFTKEMENPILYKGEDTLEGILSFLKTNLGQRVSYSSQVIPEEEEPLKKESGLEVNLEKGKSRHVDEEGWKEEL